MEYAELNHIDCKTYLLVSDTGKEAALIDPLLEKTDEYLALLIREGLALKYVVDTHTHADHLSGCALLRDKTGADYVMFSGALPRCVSKKIEDGETLTLGLKEMKFLLTPGHTTDSTSILFDGALYSGDFLFIGDLGAGRLDLPGGDPSTHFHSLKKLDDLPGETLLLPGHDYQNRSDSLLGKEREANPVLRPSWERDSYVHWWNDKKFGPADWMRGVVKANAACTRDLRCVEIPKVAAACACASVSDADFKNVPHILAADMFKLLGKAAEAPLVLDVRNASEYNDDLGHIAGSHLIPVDVLPERLAEIPRDRAVIAVCRSGARAVRAAKVLADNGWEKVWVLTGGMTGWNQAKLPVA
jgi:glyoxylase-like metal-dependent hydrolase (beta-lactamase superfamily II)/rhodanese-related sulfurtransferase